MNTLHGAGKIIFDPVPLTGKVEKLFKPHWAIISVDDDVDDYYRWFLNKRFNLILQPPAWGPHITVADGLPPAMDGIWDQVKAKYNNQTVEFEYENFPKSNGKHWWLRVKCDIIAEVRSELHLPKGLKWGLHLTLGLPIPRHEEHSIYIHRIETQGFCNILTDLTFKGL